MDAWLANPELPLPDDVPTLQRCLRQLLDEVRAPGEQNAPWQQRRDGLWRHRFAPRSERSRRRERPADEPAGTTPGGHGRQSLPEHLPRQRVEYDLTEAEKLCPCCGQSRV